MDRTPGELTVTDLPTAGRADTSGFAHRIRWEVVMQQKRLFVRALQRIDELLVLCSAERRDHQGLSFAAGEQRRTVSARQHAHFGDNRAHGLQITAVDALVGIENIPTHDLGFEFFEYAGDRQLVVLRFGALREEMRHYL